MSSTAGSSTTPQTGPRRRAEAEGDNNSSGDESTDSEEELNSPQRIYQQPASSSTSDDGIKSGEGAKEEGGEKMDVAESEHLSIQGGMGVVVDELVGLYSAGKQSVADSSEENRFC